MNSQQEDQLLGVLETLALQMARMTGLMAELVDRVSFIAEEIDGLVAAADDEP
jgi:hypothetical protein